MRKTRRTFRLSKYGREFTEAECLRGLAGAELRELAFDMASELGPTTEGEPEFRKLEMERRGNTVQSRVQPPERERLRLEILKRLR